MPDEKDLNQDSIMIPEKHYLKWLNEQSNIARLKLKYQFASEAMPYIVTLILFILTAVLCPTALIIVIPGLITLLVQVVKNQKG